MKIQLTNIDVRKALSNGQFRNKYNINYKEPLFIRYLKEQENITLEHVDILANKYGFSDLVSIDNLNINQECFNSDKYEYMSFPRYLKNVKFDEYAIAEIVTAAAAEYVCTREDICLNYERDVIKEALDTSYLKLIKETDKLRWVSIHMRSTYLDVLDNYVAAGLAKVNDDIYREFCFSYQADKYLDEYAKVYGEDKVEYIKKLMK